jgi:hypothetical protein
MDIDWRLAAAVAGAVIGVLTLAVKFGQAMFRLGERIGRAEEHLENPKHITEDG